jgi:hypothetical protein
MGQISSKAKHHEWRDFVNFVKQDPQTLLSIVSNAEPIEKKSLKPVINQEYNFFSPKSQHKIYRQRLTRKSLNMKIPTSKLLA